MSNESLRPVRDELFLRDTYHAGDVVGLRASRCRTCGLVAFPLRSHCEDCASEAEAIELSSRAKLRVATEVIHPPPDAEVPVPYGVGLVEFPEGLSILGLLDDALRAAPAIDGEVECYAVEFVEGQMTYGFRRPAS